MEESIKEWCERHLREGFKYKTPAMTAEERAEYLAAREREHAERLASGWYDTLENPPGWGL